MGTVLSYSSNSTLTSGDQILIWDTTNGDTRRASINVLTSYVSQNLGAALANSLTVTEYVKTEGMLVSDLPAAATSQGAHATVTNANATLTAGIGAVVAAGGANVVPVFCDGINWRIG